MHLISRFRKYAKLSSNFVEWFSCQRFGEDIGKLIMIIYKGYFDISLKNMITEKMMSNVYMFSPWMHDGILCDVDSTGVVAS